MLIQYIKECLKKENGGDGDDVCTDACRTAVLYFPVCLSWHILSSRGCYMTQRALLQPGEELQVYREANVLPSSAPTALFRN